MAIFSEPLRRKVTLSGGWEILAGKDLPLDLAFNGGLLPFNRIKFQMHFPLKTSVEPHATHGSSGDCQIKELGSDDL